MQIDDLKTLGGRLRYARELAPVPAAELSELAGLNRSHVGLIESGARGSNVSFETLRKLAWALGTTIDWLGYGRGEMPKPKTVQDAVQAARAAQQVAS